MKVQQKVSDRELLQACKQKPIKVLATIALANLAWKCSQEWETHPLTSGRIEQHQVERITRQSARTFPPQTVGTGKSIISRLIELWEVLPQEIKLENKVTVAKRKISEWALNGHDMTSLQSKSTSKDNSGLAGLTKTSPVKRLLSQ